VGSYGILERFSTLLSDSTPSSRSHALAVLEAHQSALLAAYTDVRIKYIDFCDNKEAKEFTSHRLRVINLPAQKVLDDIWLAIDLFNTIATELSLPQSQPHPVLSLPDYNRPLNIKPSAVEKARDNMKEKLFPRALGTIVAQAKLDSQLKLVNDRLGSAVKAVGTLLQQGSQAQPQDIAYLSGKLRRTLGSLERFNDALTKQPGGQLSATETEYKAWYEACRAYLKAVQAGIPVRLY
jgi:hypothetical protein